MEDPQAIQSQVLLLPPSALTDGLEELWRQQVLCDILLVPGSCSGGVAHPPNRAAQSPTQDAARLPHTPAQSEPGRQPVLAGSSAAGGVAAHQVVLAATCDYFRALLAGAGAHMSEQHTGAPAAGALGRGPHPRVVQLPGVDGWALRLAVGALYERRLEIGAHTLEPLLAAASFLGAAALLEACVAFMRSSLGLHTCLPLLLLAWRYDLGPLRDELLSYVGRRFSVMVRSGSGGSRTRAGAGVAPAPGGHPSHGDRGATAPAYTPPASVCPAACPMDVDAGADARVAAEGGLRGGSSCSDSGGSSREGSRRGGGRGRISGGSGQSDSCDLGQWEEAAPWAPGSVDVTGPDPGGRGSQAAGDRREDLVPGGHAGGDRGHRLPAPGPLGGLEGGGGAAQQAQGAAQAGGGPSDVDEEVLLVGLPAELLLELLRSEDLVAECESDVVQCILDWLAQEGEGEEADEGESHDASAAAAAAAAAAGRVPASSASEQPAGQRRSDAAAELAALVHWEYVPDLPNLSLNHGSPAAYARALQLLLAALQHHHGHPPREGNPMALGHGSEPPAVGRLRQLHAQLQQGADPLATRPLPPLAPGAAAPHAHNGAALAHRPGAAAWPAAAPGGASGPTAAAPPPSRAHPLLKPSGGRPRRHLASRLLCAGGHDGSWRAVKAVEVYDPHTDTWTSGPSLMQGLSFAAGAMVPGGVGAPGFTSLSISAAAGGGRRDGEQCAGGGSGAGGGGSAGAVYVVGGTPLCSSVWRLRWGGDGCAGRAWEVCPNLRVSRAHAGMVAVAGSMLVTGGRSQVQQVQHVLSSVEIYLPGGTAPSSAPHLSLGPSPLLPDPAACLGLGCWTRGPDMVNPRSAHACAVLGGCVYAVGGTGGSGRGTQRSVEVLDLGTETWRVLGAEMTTERKYTAAAALGGRLYVVGGVNDSRTRLAALEALDPREGRWTTLAPMAHRRSSCAAAALGGALYVAGGQYSSADVAAAAPAGAAGVLGLGLGVGGGWVLSPPLAAGPAAAGAAAAGIGVYGSPPGSGYGTAGAMYGGAGMAGVYGSSAPTASAVAGSAWLGSYGSGPVQGPGGAAAGVWGPRGAAAGSPGATTSTGGGVPGAGAGVGVGLGYAAGLGSGLQLGGLVPGGGFGAAGDEGSVLGSVECYDPVAGRWRACAPLGCARSGLALCAV